jgi:hypothetical protein
VLSVLLRTCEPSDAQDSFLQSHASLAILARAKHCHFHYSFFFERKNSIRHWHPSTTKSKYHHLPCLLVERNSAAKLTVSPLMVAMLVLCVKWSCIEFAGIFIKRRASSSRTFSCCANWMLTRSNASLASTIFLLSHTP